MKFIGKLTSFRNALQQGNAGMIWICVGVFFLIAMTVHFDTVAGEPERRPGLSGDTVSAFSKNILFQKNSAVILRDYAGNNARIDSIVTFLRNTDAHNLLGIKVEGSYSPEGDYGFNANLAAERADALSALVREINPGLNPLRYVRHTLEGQDSDYRRLRSAELQIVYRRGASVKDSVFCKCPPPQHFS